MIGQASVFGQPASKAPALVAGDSAAARSSVWDIENLNESPRISAQPAGVQLTEARLLLHAQLTVAALSLITSRLQASRPSKTDISVASDWDGADHLAHGSRSAEVEERVRGFRLFQQASRNRLSGWSRRDR